MGPTKVWLLILLDDWRRPIGFVKESWLVQFMYLYFIYLYLTGGIGFTIEMYLF